MSEKTNETGHVYLKDRMAGYRGWFKAFVLGVFSLIMISTLVGNFLQSF